MIIIHLYFSLGFCILCGHGFSIVLSRLQKENSPSKIKIVNGSSHHQEATLYQEHAAVSHLKESKLSFVLWASLFLLISTFIMRTIDRNEVWKSRETLFRYMMFYLSLTGIWVFHFTNDLDWKNFTISPFWLVHFNP